MPRYYRRRYTRVVRPKKKWSSNITVWTGGAISSPYVTTLVENKTQSLATAPTPVILKTGNFKISIDMVYLTSETLENVNLVATCYVLFVPEGIEDSAVPGLVTTHPEYIMATKIAGGSLQTGRNFQFETVNVSTRLKRNLNSGDRVVFCVLFNSTAGGSIRLVGNCRYWCCSN